MLMTGKKMLTDMGKFSGCSIAALRDWARSQNVWVEIWIPINYVTLGKVR